MRIKLVSRSLLVKWVPLLVWCLLIFFLSSMHSIQATEEKFLDFILHKLAHIAEYAFLFILFFRAFNKRGWPALIFAIFYAATDEIHQLFVPTREGRIRDLFFDTTGAFLGWFVIWKLSAILPSKLKNWLTI